MIKKSLLAKIVNGNPKEINIVDDQVYVINNEYEAQEQLPNSHKITNKNKLIIIAKAAHMPKVFEFIYSLLILYELFITIKK